MFYLRYIWSELRRRRGRTIFTALGLGVGVGLVVTVSALSSGLDQAQSKVLEPLTGVGTDMTVNRPIVVSGSGSNQSFSPGEGPQLSQKEQRELQRENGGGRLDLSRIGNPGQHFSTTRFMSTDLSFPASEEKKIDRLEGVQGSSRALTLNMIHLTGTVPESTSSQPQVFGGPPAEAGGGSVNFQPVSVSGIETQELRSRPDHPEPDHEGAVPWRRERKAGRPLPDLCGRAGPLRRRPRQGGRRAVHRGGHRLGAPGRLLIRHLRPAEDPPAAVGSPGPDQHAAGAGHEL